MENYNYKLSADTQKVMFSSGVITSGDIYKIITKTLGLVNEKAMEHSEIVAYTLYQMLMLDNKYRGNDLIDFTMVALLHDLGVFKAGQDAVMENETKLFWDHSIYGYLFLRYLSPLNEKAEVVLYHHLNVNLHSRIPYEHMKVAEYLAFADKLDVYRRMRTPDMPNLQQYIAENEGKTISAESKLLFLNAEKKFHITDHIKDGSYRLELQRLFALRRYTEDDKRGFLQLLNYTIDFRSEFTVLHTLGTTTFATELAKALKVSEEDAYNIYYGALMHDIGKMMVPVEILESPTRLTDEEMAIMKKHAEYTEEILSGVLNPDVVRISARHHEKLDGSGYPRGLKADDLTEPQRIVAVADIWSALYQKRSYKDAFDEEKIKSILTGDVKNGKICPKVVKCALEHFDEIVANFESKREDTMGLYMHIKEQYAAIYERFKSFDAG